MMTDERRINSSVIIHRLSIAVRGRRALQCPGMELEKWLGEFVTRSEIETIRLGRSLGKALTPPRVVLLYGDLGAGKTTLVKGIAQGLGVRNRHDVNSPTFVLINEYQGRCKIYHADLYRLDTVRDLESIGLDEIMHRDAVTLIEWGEKLAALPEHALTVRIQDLGGDRRRIQIQRMKDEG